MGSLTSSASASTNGNPTLKMGNTVEGCKVRKDVKNSGDMRIQSDSKTNYEMGHTTTNTECESIHNESNFIQT